MKPRQQKTPAVRRADILCASEKLFLQKGINATRVEDIANIDKNTLCFCFRNKENIISESGQLDYFVERIACYR